MVTFIEHGETIHLHFEGDINFETVRKIEVKIRDWIVPSHTKKITLDFQKVKFVDSTGVGFLISRIHPLTSRYQVEINNASLPVKNILQICKLDSLVKIL
ncbi:STAS domain-containing protein [Aneurinibacillus terranovensis]|uniref:STAS domain-containing protein n=1 Tax=Aneurinibacillus terranovensis TaxID=278991 RepID=UPI000408C8EF|nr:STAS domain-containing protein [Aneurinibacillus terranovensis]